MRLLRAATTPCDPPKVFGCQIARPRALLSFLPPLTTNFSAVYVVVMPRGGPVQYVGESQEFPERFKKGVNDKNDYRWPIAGSSYEVFAWEIFDQPEFRKAVELEVAMRVRLFTGHWPVELKAVQPQHHLRGNYPSLLADASARAGEITDWLRDNQKYTGDQLKAAILMNVLSELESERLKVYNP